MDSAFYRLSEDVMGNIFSRLPAPHFSSAACVSKTWNKVCGEILKAPKLASALSQEPDIYYAVNEVVDKVLAEPIIPHFAIACIGKHFSLPLTHQLLLGRLGSTVPLITNAAGGIIGADTVTNELQDLMWDPIEDEEDEDRGIVLVIGFVPGLKVEAIPLIRTHAGPGMCLVDNFLRDIHSFTAFYQDSESPTGIIMFGDRNLDMKPILARMDCALSEETVIVGDASGCFLCNNYYSDRYSIDAIALVFARNRDKSPGGADIGETQFHVTLSPGIIPFGLELQAVCAMEKENGFSWLAARAEGHFQILDGEGLLRDIRSEIDDVRPDLYIGAVQHRNYISQQGFLQGTTLAFYRVSGGVRDFIIVEGIGINPGDPFLFYHSDSATALASCTEAYNNLEILKEELKGNSGEGKVIGGFMFSSYQRSDQLSPKADISSFRKNFPEVPLAGVFSIGEIARGSSGSISQENDAMNRARCCLHYYSTVYLTLSYTPPNPEH